VPSIQGRESRSALSSRIPVDDWGLSPFRAAVESKDVERVIETLAPDIVFRSPAVFSPYSGRETVATLLRAVDMVLAPNLVYQWQVQEDDREVLCFTSRVGKREIEGVDILRYDDAGQVAELVVMMRPLSGLRTVSDGVGAQLEAARS